MAEPKIAQTDAGLKSIQVAGLKNFAESRWREAILYYLNGIWAGKKEVCYRPKIAFGGLTLRLAKGEYYIEGTPPNTKKEWPKRFTSSDTLVLMSDQAAEVECALVRFVKNDKIRQMAILLPRDHTFYLWKKDRRGEYGCYAAFSRS